MTALLAQAMKLPIEQRIELVEALLDSIAEESPRDLPIPDWHHEVLDRRLAELASDPEAEDPWDEVKARLERLA